ncbi:hypothetical protein COLO4_03423 [Corchorus olitorius]|uniref:Uncharacterized protein n=1 Tax=Corchorus olitorius TaxID=93759 RepID=A0A1R3KYT0_9ROSI|nr:hypothetical protein COLO4_03423 [Corchorus olitorius]
MRKFEVATMMTKLLNRRTRRIKNRLSSLALSDT